MCGRSVCHMRDKLKQWVTTMVRDDNSGTAAPALTAETALPLPSPAREFLECLTGELPRLRGAAMMMTHSRADADDLIQSTAMRAIAAHAQFTMGTNMRAWLYRIMRNVFVDLVRMPQRQASRLEDISDEFLRCEPSQEGRIEMREVLRAINRLTPIHREALLLSAVEALSYDEIAALQGCAVGTVKSRISRARRQVQVMMDYTEFRLTREDTEVSCPAAPPAGAEV
jgi:RNA polymerase sigma-70 factor (ECF subfamily)